MKPLIIYQTRTGNTRIIADIIASKLDADVLPVEKACSDDFNGRTLVGFGSGIYYTKVDAKIYHAASLLPPGCNAFMFITSGMGSPFMLRLYWFLIGKAFKRSGIKLAGTWDCRGYDQHPLLKWMGISKGRPNRVDIESAEQFALNMQRLCI